MELLDWLRSLTISTVFIRLILAALAGMLIGLDREYRNKGAGIRTHALVCIGSALMMMIGEYAFQVYPDSNIDVTRMGGQVVTGIGFLGAGTIIVTGRRAIKGLTTAAGLWAASGVGLSIGIGFIEGAVFGLILILFVLKIMYKLDDVFHRDSKEMELFVQLKEPASTAGFLKAVRDKNIHVFNVSIYRDKSTEGHPEVTMSLQLPKYGMKEKFKKFLDKLDEVIFYSEI
jgi:putative Mg2+ transporter-C (MgtC) family protein